VAYGSAQARKEMLDSFAAAIRELGVALAALGAAYEQLDENAADRLEAELFRPVQTAYGRAQRTYAAFASRHELPRRSFLPAPQPAPSTQVAALVESAAEHVARADETIAEEQDSMRPVEVGDQELRAGLAEVRSTIDQFRVRSRRLASGFGR
jgi:hypothetical protein